MAVLVSERGMNSDENDKKNESSHESNVYFDRQLQNKLLQVDDDSDTDSYDSKLSKSWSNVKSGAKSSSKTDSRTEDITGWFPSAKFVGRRNDVSKTESKPANTFIHPWKDYRSKKEQKFVFKHYTEFRKYMEQYRNQHACHINRSPSGNQVGEMRRMAFQQSSAPSQQTSVTVHQLHQPGYANSAPPTSCNGSHYTTRKEQLGTLITPSSNCSCNAKTNVLETTSQLQRYKMIPGQISRTNTNYDLRHVDSDHSSECGDLRYRTPSRRTNSASSTRSRTITGKSPTKISVPANPNSRAYPVQALTIAIKARYQRQQNGKAEACPSPRPLDNLNCVAPEKQLSGPSVVDRKNFDPNLELALRVHSLNDLLTTNEAPLRGYALPKSMPPNPNPNNGAGSELSDTDSDDVISLDQLSTCPLSADVKFKKKLESQSQHLQKFLKEDPMLSTLNQKPDLQTNTLERQNLSTATQMFNSDSFLLSQNDVDAMLRVNMWNPILSVPVNGARRDLASQNYKNLMAQLPFRMVDDRVKPYRSIDNDIKTSYQEKIDYFNPMKKVRLSITRLDNAVSFCRTQVQNIKKDPGEKRSISRGTNSSSLSSKGDNIGDQISVKLKPPLFDPFTGKLTRPTKFEQKLNLPIPQAKILESIPVEKILRNSASASLSHNITSESSPRPSTGSKQVTFNDIQGMNYDANNHSAQEPKDANLAASYQLKPNNVAKDENIKFEDQLKNDISNTNKTSTLEEPEEMKSDDKQKLYSVDTENGETAKHTQNSGDGSNLSIEGLTGVKMNIDNRKNERLDKMDGCKQKMSSRKLVKKPAVASGVGVIFCYYPELSCTKYNDSLCGLIDLPSKCMKSHPELEGLTWAEKLEVLRSVNKPREKPKNKQQKLKFVRAESKDPVYTFSFEQDHLYEQRRIKHLVEQARIKGGRQFDWVYEAQVKYRGVDWNTEPVKESDGAVSGQSSGDEGTAGDSNLGKYGICVPPKHVKQRLFDSHGVNRSNTYIAP